MEGTNGYGSETASWLSIAHQIAELRREVGESECSVKESIHEQSLAHSAEFCGVNKNVSDNGTRNVIEILTNRAAIKEAECMLGKSILENRYILGEKIDRETDILKLQLGNFERQTAENFCNIKSEIKDARIEAKDNTQRILDRLTSDKLDEKNNLIDELRHLNRHKDFELFIGNKFSSIEAMVNSIHQEQRFSSKTVQFGTGNLAGTAQTANQG